MQLIKALTKDEFVATFLKSEIHSPRFGPAISAILERDGIPERVITDPDTSNEDENRTRTDVLGESRGYKTNARLFKGFPDDMRWSLARLTQSELSRVLYIDYDYWVEFSGGSRLVADGAERIRSKKAHNRYVESLATELPTHQMLPELILVGDKDRGKLVLLEGHVRLTAYLLRQDVLPEALNVIIGFSKKMSQWDMF